jgi:cytochrome o ubiquinol oxidase operon protein cyoD
MHKSIFATYIIGFLLSIILTTVAYIFAMDHITSRHEMFSHAFLIPLFIVLAFIQLVVQLIYFLHIGADKKSRWNLVFFVSTFSIVLLVVVASLWIMYHLNYNMTPQQMNSKVMMDEGMGE